MFGVDPWRFQAHPEVWLLVAAVVGCYSYAIVRIGPKAVPEGTPVVTSAQLRWFVAAVATLWAASDWPIHDIGEQYLYSVHMLQHMMLAYFMPPMVLLATPEWLARLVVGDGRAYRVVRWLRKPVVAGVMFNVTIMVTHVPGIVNESASSAPLHYSLHLTLVTMALLMWMSICGPIPEWRIGPAATMIYLFLNSVVPTVPAGWLVFAEGIVYKHYDVPTRVFGLSPTYDQQLAGVIMKVGGSIFLWTIVIVIWFTRFSAGFEADQSYRRPHPPVPLEPPGGIEAPPVTFDGLDFDSSELTFDEVERAFEKVPAPPEPEHPVS